MRAGKRNTCLALLIILVMSAVFSFVMPGEAPAMNMPDAVGDFGATGDGVADDTASLQAALDTGELVYLPTGTYKVTAHLDLSNGSGFVGTPEAIVRFDGDYRFQGNHVSDLLFSNFTIQRNMPANTATEASIQLFYCHDIVIDAMRILDHKSLTPAITIRGSFVDLSDNTESYNVRITDNVIENYQRVAPDGIGSGGDEGVKGSGISVAHTKDFVISGNRVVEKERYFTPSSSLVNFQGSGIEVISSIYGTVTNNVVDYAGQGIDIGGGHNINSTGQTTDNGFRGSQYVTVTGNSIVDIYSAGIKFVNGASFNTVSGNTIARSGLVGIWLGPGATAVQDKTTIKGNIIYGNTVTDTGSGPGMDAWTLPGTKRGTGITIEEARDLLTRPTLNVIAGNVVIDTKGIMKYGISDNGVFSEDVPHHSFDNYFFANYASGAAIQNFNISSTNKYLSW